MTTQYIAQQPINHNGTAYAVGDAVDATAAEAKFLLLAGYVTEAPQSPKEPKYDTWLKAALNAELDKREIEHDETATNAVLADLLVADDLSREGREMKAGDKEK